MIEETKKRESERARNQSLPIEAIWTSDFTLFRFSAFPLYFSYHHRMSKHKHKNKNKKRIKNLTAKNADKFDLYLRSVQEPLAEIDFFDRVYRAEFGKKAMLLREDFCAAAAVCCEWVRTHKDRKAVGYDLDEQTLQWGRDHNLCKLTEQEQQRVSLIKGDVRDASKEKAQIIAAENFSFFLFRTRDALRDYFKSALKNLAPQGILVTDMMGGGDCMKEHNEDTRKIRIEKDGIVGIPYSKNVKPNDSPVYDKTSFKYIWEQDTFNPITHHGTYFIHFRFKDGTELSNAFRYDWRLWSIPEVRELMLEAGFSKADVYWEGPGKDGDGDGIYKKREKVENDDVWIAYVVGVK